MSRKDVEEEIYSVLDEMTKDKSNSDIYKKLFSGMSDKKFKSFMMGIKDGSKKLIITAPNHSKVRLDVETNIKIAKRYGHSFFEHLIIGSDDPNVPAYKTPEKYMVVNLPVRRPAQTVRKTISVSGDASVRDTTTKQPAAKSRAASISLAETNILKGLGFDALVEELNKARGGDEGYFNAFNAMAAELGTVSLDRIKAASTGVDAKKAVKTFMLGQHIRSNL